MSEHELILGIDLGTTFSVAAYVDDRGQARVIRSAEGEKTTPSVVLIDEGQAQVGTVAVNQALARKGDVIQWIKRSMGDLDYRCKGLGPIEISAEILKKIKNDCEEELGELLTKAVITCPAYFSASEVENTRKAGEAAGFLVQEIVREPTAAAVYYGVENLGDGDRLLVCDLGGGTFDASILALEGDTFVPLATTGSRELGGHDWTSDLMEHVAEVLEDQLDEDPRHDPSTEQALYEACEAAKRGFSRAEESLVACVHQGKPVQVKVTRDDFEQLTEWRIREMLKWTTEALAKPDPALGWEDISQILLVGGSTRLRRVAESLEQLSGKKPVLTAEADTMVALGAAILARGAYRPRRKVASSGIKQNVVSGLTIIKYARIAERNLGTRAIVRKQNKLTIENSAIIPYGTKLPTSRTREDYQISSDGQASFDVPIVEFDGTGADEIQETYRFSCPAGLTSGTPVHVTFEYDKSGEITVGAMEQHGGTTLAKEKIPYEEPDLEGAGLSSSPRAIVFALDISGSMISFNKIDRAKQAIIDNARALLVGGPVQVGVVIFGSTAHVICPLTGDADEVDRTVSPVDVSGSTAMGQGLSMSLDLLAELDAGVAREIVLVSDGMPDNDQTALEAGSRATREKVNIWSLGLGSEGIDQDFLGQIAPKVLVVEDMEGISEAMASLLTLGAQPSSAASGITWLGGDE